MQWTRAAKGHQGELARIVALLYRDQPQRANHRLVGDVDDAFGGRLHRQAQRSRHRAYRLLGGTSIEHHAAAEQRLRKVPKDEVRVGHGRLRSSGPVGSRSRDRSRTLRPDSKRLGQLGDVGDRPTSCADAAHIDRRHL